MRNCERRKRRTESYDELKDMQNELGPVGSRPLRKWGEKRRPGY
jgi:hypothetical protein